MNEKYICARIETLGKQGAKRMYLHNIRKKPASYREINENTDKNTYWLDPNYNNSSDFLSEAANDVEILYYNKKNKILPKNAKPFRQMYIVLTPDENFTFDQYKQILDKALNNIKNYFEKNNIEMLHYAYHWDEKTPHIHILFKNQNINTGNTLRNLFKKQELSKLQDIVAQDLPYNYIRGMKGSRKTSLSIANAHRIFLKNTMKELEVKKQELEDINKKIDIKKQEYKNFKNEVIDLKKLIFQTKVFMQDNLLIQYKSAIKVIDSINKSLYRCIYNKDNYSLNDIPKLFNSIQNLIEKYNFNKDIKVFDKVETKIQDIESRYSISDFGL
jgi:hypothetical protein